ncbi:TSC complex subunit 1a isoform X2 [Nelusetta ayraudi]|uniref:TSC complex subunit 1a isoform X2 n=1 Tax=Nelusetta ayraudi TaxID=303726 RepID=UPI003F71DF67
MSKEQVSISELLLSLDSSELQEAEQVRAAVNQQLSSDRGAAVLLSLVEYYLESSSPQAVLLLSSIREPHHKALLEKLNESLGRPAPRLAALNLLGHLIRKQPPWVHHISRSPLLASLLRCLKTDTDVVVLITAVLVLITLLPMIPQAGKQHIFDFFDVFGRLASWSYKNPGQVPVVHLVHLHAGVYSLFHRLYGMFPCNFVSYLRLHYSMKENLDTFQEVVKPMLNQVRVHPELVTGTQDLELDPTRWKCYEVHDIVLECSRVSLDPLESSCEDDTFSSLRDPPPPPSPSFSSSTSSSPAPKGPPPTGPPHLNLSPGSSLDPLLAEGQLTANSSLIQADDVTWSPSLHCGMSTPPPEPASSQPPSRTSSTSGAKGPPSASMAATSRTEERHEGSLASIKAVKLFTEPEGSTFRPITEKEARSQSDVANNNNNSDGLCRSRQPVLTSTPLGGGASAGSELRLLPCSIPLSFTSEDGGPSSTRLSPAPPYEALFELALPRAATLLIERKTKEVMERTAAVQQREVRGDEEQEEEEGREEQQSAVSPLEVLDQLIIHGHDAHEGLSRRLSAANRSLDRSHFGGKQQSMKSKGPAQGEELQSLRSQLLLVHSQLQYERFKRQQHAVRNRRLLRRVINAATLEEQGVAMKGQLSALDEEIRSLRTSLEEEQRRYRQLQQETHARTGQLQDDMQQLQAQRQEEQRDKQRLQSELQDSRSRLGHMEAELQKANNQAYNAEHQLTQLSVKLSSSEELQQHVFLLNQQLVLLREANRGLREQLDRGDTHCCTEASMLQCTVGKEYQRLKDSDVQQRQKLEAANHRTAELESQLAKKEQLIQEQKKLLEDTKNQSRAELSACESRCVALRRLVQTLQTEMLQLYSQVRLEAHSRPNGSVGGVGGGGVPSPALPGGRTSRPPASSSVGIINGGVEALSTSPLHLLSCSSSPLSLSPIESPLAVGSYLEQRARQLFRPANQSQEEEEEEEEEEGQQQEEEEEQEEQEAQPESPPVGQEAEEAILLAGSPPLEPQASAHLPAGAAAPPADLTLAVRQRRHELTIMDYDEMLPEY